LSRAAVFLKLNRMKTVTGVSPLVAVVILALLSLFILTGCASTDASVGITSVQGPRTPESSR
jgi:hypothetical protein